MSIQYAAETAGELPFIVAVIADLKGYDPSPAALKDAAFLRVDSAEGLDPLVKAIRPQLHFSVEDFAVELHFESMQDFEPQAIAEQGLFRQIDLILHSPEFQKLEASWRGLEFLLKRTQTSDSLQIHVLNTTKRAVSRDLRRAVTVEQSILFRRFAVDSDAPFSLMVADWELDGSPADLELLERISQVAEGIHAPFLAGVNPVFFDAESFAEVAGRPRVLRMLEGASHAKWRSFRRSESSRWVGLTMPRIRLRPLYGFGGPKGLRVEGYREQASTDSTTGHLWGSAAWAYASCITKAFARDHWCAHIQGEGGMVHGLPLTIPASAGPLDATFAEDTVGSAAHALSRAGFITCMPRPAYWRDQAFVFLRAAAVHQPQEVESVAAAEIFRRLVEFPYLFAVSRIAQALRVLLRAGRSYGSVSECERAVNDWVSRYIRPASATAEEGLARPLRQAHVSIVKDPADAARFLALIRIYPIEPLPELELAPPPARVVLPPGTVVPEIS